MELKDPLNELQIPLCAVELNNQLHELPIPLFAEITTGPVNKLHKIGWDSKWVRKATVYF